MTTRILYLLIFAGLFSHSGMTNAQETYNQRWDKQKIKGVRHIAYPTYTGLPFLTDVWVPGQIEFSNGEFADSLFLRYSAFKDELLYYNKTLSSQIVIDKESINGFSFTEPNGNLRTFRKQYYDGFLKGDRYFEILSKGETDLLVYRKRTLTTTTPYKDEQQILKDQEYTNSYQFYFYSPGKGYALVRPNLNAFLDTFSEADQKPVKKLLRKNRVRISNEESLVLAWKIVERAGYKVILR
jgi:hypothetical protein